MRDINAEPLPPNSVAIIGMAGRFPGANTVAEFWRNQLAGKESISTFSIEELEPADQVVARENPSYVRARSIIEGVDQFDAEFFGIYPLEATYMDPQHRLFMESCWQAFEAAGYDPAAYPGMVGVYAGCSIPTYFVSRLCKQPGFIDRFAGEYQVGSFTELLGNGLDFFASKIAYKFDLKGPAMTITTACSTSLVAVAQACQALLTYQCDMALAGGASISLPQKRGTNYIEGGMTSPDGHCRTFDADAGGTVFGSGVGVALLKRLEDAIEDRDTIHAVIRGFGLNNDGSNKVGYTAPSIEGQARVIAMAQDLADVDPETIGYVEAHGTGTPLGDPIELAALSKAFGTAGGKSQFCTIGTAKTNVGHLDAAAGVTGLIHAAHIVRDGKLPPTLHFKAPNPKFDMANSPFRVNTELTDWVVENGKRRAGVSAFGVGGTNAHVVLEEAPVDLAVPSAKPAFILPLSARSESALGEMSRNLAAHLDASPKQMLADIAWTLQTGRRRFQHARVIVAGDREAAIGALKGDDPDRMQSRSGTVDGAKIHFMFPGQGAQHVGMAAGLYRDEPVFRDAFNACSAILEPLIGGKLQDFLYPTGEGEGAGEALKNTAIAQPAIFTLEYALAKLWQSWGITPDVLIGHSIGEFAAACIAGVFTLDDALALVAARGRLMRDVPRGSMLAVSLPESDLVGRLKDGLSIAAINAPRACVVAGPSDALAALEAELRADKVTCRALVTSHAFHSAMMDPVVEPFRDVVSKVVLKAPQIPMISTVTGAPLTASEATNPDYWARHLRQPVRFSAAIAPCRQDAQAVLVEIGPGNTLNTLARLHPANDPNQVVVSSLGGPGASEPDCETILHALGALWLAGVMPDWRGVAGDELVDRRRVELPTYPFERKRYWLDVPASTAQGAETLSPVSTEISTPQLDASPMTQSFVPAPSASVPVSAEPRKVRIRKALVDVFEDLSGKELTDAPAEATFLELGFDSLFLTQATRAVQKETGLKITFRQLLGPLGTFDALAAYADEKLDASAYPAPVAAVPVETAMVSGSQPVTPVAVVPMASVGAGGSALERLLQDQLQTMNQIFAAQIAAVQGQPAGALPAVVPAASPVAKPVAAPVAAKPSDAAAAASGTTGTDAKSHGPYAPIKARSSSGMTERQARKVAEIVADYTKFSPESKRLTETHRKRLADPRVVSGFQLDWKETVYPIITKGSKGSKLIDVDGNEYIDLLNGFGPIMFGHRPDFVEAALREQVGEGFEIGPQTPLAGEIAEIFCDMTGNERMTFCNTGSEAVMAAMRLARTVTGREKIVMFAGDYHGMFDEVLVKPWRAKDGTPGAVPLAPGIPRESIANIVVLDYGTDESLAWIRDNADDLAAVIVEPVQSRRPDFQPIAFLKEVREITRTSGTAFVFDEVVTGFRTHPGGCQTLFGIRADMATYGKVLGGGMPIGVLAGRAEFMDALDGGQWRFGDQSCPEVGMTFFAGTFVRHPLTLAAVKAVLLKIKDEGSALQERLAERTTAMVGRINAVLDRYGVPTHMKNFKSFMYFKFAPDERFASLFYFLLRRNGVHIQEGFPCFMTSAHSDADIDKVVAAFEIASREMRDGDLFPGAVSVADGVNDVASSTMAVADIKTVPLTEPQREIFHAAIMGDDVSCAFNESFSIALTGPLDTEALMAAIDQVIARHEALRGTVDTDGARLNIAPKLQIAPIVDDFSGLDENAARAAFEELLADDALTPFDMFVGPLFRARLVRMAGDRHELVVSAHHIICDGWSCGLVANEIAELYSALVERREAQLDEPASYSEYAVADVQLRDSSDNRDAEHYWLDVYKTIPALPDLPTDHPRSDVRTFAGATAFGTIGRDLYEKIKAGATGKGVSLFVMLLSGYTALLNRLSGQTDLAVGIPLAGQTALDNPNLVGHCVNALPLRLEVSPTTTVGALLTHAREKLLDAYDHQSFTYGTLVQKLGVKRDPARLPLSEVQFNVEQFASTLSFAGMTAKATANPKSAVNADMFLNIVESPDGLRLEWDYNKDLYEEETIRRWMRAFEQIVVQLAGDNDKAIGALDVASVTAPAAIAIPSVSEDDLARIMAWNQTAIAFPRDKSIVNLFEEQVELAPNATALVFEQTSISYGALNARANKIANALVNSGVAAGDLVAVCLPRSPDVVAAILGVLKAGAAYVPVDPQSPGERIQYMLKDSGAAAVLTQRSVGLQSRDARIVLIEDVDATELAGGQENLSRKPSPDDLAYVMYTSGSTGLPKGVMVEHRAAVQLVRNSDIAAFGPDETALMSVSVSFDPSLLDLLGMLLNGGRLVVMPPEPAVPSLIAKMVKEHDVTSLFTTTGVFHVLVEDHLAEIGTLRQICVGGEVLSPVHAQTFVDSMPNATLIAAYGPTEATTISTFTHYKNGDRIPDPVPIGKPMANTRVYVVDGALRQVPVGGKGELVIAGDGLARGYLKRPELTGEKFVEIEVRPGVRERVYRSGDLASFAADGSLLFHGRMDGQIKLRGFRIEIGEIEAAMQRQPGVGNACVVPVKDGGRVTQLVGFCTPKDGAVLDAEALKQGLSGSLMAYMVPGNFVILPEFPLNVNGKIDRDKLLILAEERRSQRDYVAPANNDEAELSRITAEVMKLERVGVTENLFELGLDSLMIFQIASRATKAGVNVSPRAIMQSRTVREALVAAASAPVSIAQAGPKKITRAARQAVKLAPTVGKDGAAAE